jgi:hypothetical protein
MSTSMPMSTTVRTVAAAKLAAAVADSSLSAVARNAKSTPTTVQLMIAGARSPNTRTIGRFQSMGISPLDWFTPATAESAF